MLHKCVASNRNGWTDIDTAIWKAALKNNISKARERLVEITNYLFYSTEGTMEFSNCPINELTFR